jgi:hypothetical protein
VVAHRHLAVRHRDIDGARPLRGVVQQVRDRPLELRRVAAHDRLLELGPEQNLWRPDLGAPDRVLDQLVEADGLDLGRALPVDLDQVADQRAELFDLVGDIGEQLLALPRRKLLPAREHLDVRPHARQRRPQLVRGVGNEPALCLHGSVERAEHLVEGRREPAELVLAVDVDAT